MKKSLLLLGIALLLTSSHYAFAKNISFPVKGLIATPPAPIPVEAEWDESWFGKESSYKYNHNLARIAAVLSEVSYVEVADSPENNELIECYKALGCKKEYMEFHYNIDYESNIWGNDQSGFSFATKQIESAHGKRNLIFIVIRGTPLNANEWISNMNINDRSGKSSDYHEGFLRATAQIENALISYLLKNRIDIDDCFLLITGHSRGAALSNLFAARLYDKDLFKPENIYAYTFATPNVTTLESASDPKYGYIWNIINPEDIVPYVPMNTGNWKYHRFGNNKTLVNDWNIDTTRYNEDYLPRMNFHYKRLIGRDYYPFRLGIFIPVEASVIMSSINPTVESYYEGIKALRPKGEDVLKKIFTPKDGAVTVLNENGEEQTLLESIDEKTHNPGIVASIAARWAEKQFSQNYSNIVNTFIDMHVMETYLSWIIALDEDEAFSTLGTSFVILTGSTDYAVFDENDNCVASIQDGKVDFSKIKAPVGACSILQDHVAIGIPANRKFKIVISKESILPTPMQLKIRSYSPDGQLLKETNSQSLYPSRRTVYTFDGGEILLYESEIKAQKLSGQNARDLRVKGNIRPTSNFDVTWELSGSSSGTFNIGAHTGIDKIYGSILLGHNAAKPFRSLEVSPGVGHTSVITGRFLLDTEIFTNLFYAISDDVDNDDQKFNVVPSLRFSLSFKPKHKTQLFFGTNFDFHINDFNDAAFDSDFRSINVSFNSGNRVQVYPNIQFGIKF